MNEQYYPTNLDFNNEEELESQRRIDEYLSFTDQKSTFSKSISSMENQSRFGDLFNVHRRIKVAFGAGVMALGGAGEFYGIQDKNRHSIEVGLGVLIAGLLFILDQMPEPELFFRRKIISSK